MTNDRDERILNTIHVAALLIGRARKHVDMRNHVMAQKYLDRSKDIMDSLMSFIRQKEE